MSKESECLQKYKIHTQPFVTANSDIILGGCWNRQWYSKYQFHNLSLSTYTFSDSERFRMIYRVFIGIFNPNPEDLSTRSMNAVHPVKIRRYKKLDSHNASCNWLQRGLHIDDGKGTGVSLNLSGVSRISYQVSDFLFIHFSQRFYAHVGFFKTGCNRKRQV